MAAREVRPHFVGRGAPDAAGALLGALRVTIRIARGEQERRGRVPDAAWEIFEAVCAGLAELAAGSPQEAAGGPLRPLTDGKLPEELPATVRPVERTR